MCTPSLAIDAIIEVRKSIHTDPEEFQSDEVSVVLVKRRDPPRDVYAIPGRYIHDYQYSNIFVSIYTAIDLFVYFVGS